MEITFAPTGQVVDTAFDVRHFRKCLRPYFSSVRFRVFPQCQKLLDFTEGEAEFLATLYKA